MYCYRYRFIISSILIRLGAARSLRHPHRPGQGRPRILICFAIFVICFRKDKHQEKTNRTDNINIITYKETARHDNKIVLPNATTVNNNTIINTSIIILLLIRLLLINYYYTYYNYIPEIRATETMLAETMLADFRARAARVCRCKCMGCTTRKIQPCFLVALSYIRLHRQPVQPVRVNLPIWFLPNIAMFR